MVKPAFDIQCTTFKLDEPEAQRLVALEKAAMDEETATRGGFSIEQKGVRKGMLGGIAMIAIALVWFFVGLAADRIFFYPPILFVIGVYALIKGLATGNVAGEK
jgi:hypothetical protein